LLTGLAILENSILEITLKAVFEEGYPFNGRD